MRQNSFHRRPGVLVENADGSMRLNRFYVPDFAGEYYRQAQSFLDRGIYLAVEYLDDTDEDTLRKAIERRGVLASGRAS